jgi:hypothetical protein
MMPNPKGAKRLLTLGGTVRMKNTDIALPFEDAADPANKTLRKVNVWLVAITLPKHLIGEVRLGSTEVMSEKVEMTDIDEAYASDQAEASQGEDQTMEELGDETDADQFGMGL